MNISNLEKIPVEAQNALKPFLEELFKIYGDEIQSVFVYGSVTGKDYDPKTSDINLAIVLKDVSLDKLKQVLKPVKTGIRRNITVPLFLTTSYIEGSLDTFPMEFSSMKDSRCVLFGDDVLERISVDREDLRRECEYQLKGKLLTIRQAYLEQALNRKGIEKLIKASFRSLMPVFQSILRLKSGQTPPRDKAEILSELGEEFGIDPASFLEVLRDKKTDGRIGEKPAESFLGNFLVQLERLSEAVDKL